MVTITTHGMLVLRYINFHYRALLDFSSWCLEMVERLFLTGLSAVCDCGIFCLYSLTIFHVFGNGFIFNYYTEGKTV